MEWLNGTGRFNEPGSATLASDTSLLSELDSLLLPQPVTAIAISARKQAWRQPPFGLSIRMTALTRRTIAKAHKTGNSKFVARGMARPPEPGTLDWWFRRKRVDPKPLLSLTLSLSPDNVDPSKTLDSCDYPIHAARIIAARSAPADVLPLLEGRCGLVAVLFDTLRPTNPGWAWEALGLTELHPDAVVIASRVVGSDSQIKDAGRVLGFAGLFGCPDRGRHVNDPGFAAQMWKQRSVSGASTHFCVFDVAFMRQVLQENADRPVSWFFLGAWAAVSALKSGRRVIYSPLLSGVSDFDIDAGVSQEEMDCFRDLYGCYLPDSRYYPRHFDLQVGHAYEPISEMKREAIERQMFPREPGRRTRWSVSNAGKSRDQGAFEQLCVPSVSTHELG